MYLITDTTGRTTLVIAQTHERAVFVWAQETGRKITDAVKVIRVA